MNSTYSVVKLTKPDKPLFIALMSRAFSRDPLFLHLFGDLELDRTARSKVTAFLSFMFDKSFLLHEEIWGCFENKSLLGAYVVEKPHAGILQKVKGLGMIGRFIGLFF